MSFFFASYYACKHSCIYLWKKVFVFCRFLLISVPKSYGFDILKRCGEELKIPVSYIDGDDVNVEEGF